jgi:hypothetical protein
MHPLDPWRVAQLLLEEGAAEEAHMYAARRVVDRERAGDEAGAGSWRQVMAAIEALTAWPCEGETRH